MEGNSEASVSCNPYCHCTAIHRTFASGNGDWKRLFSRQRIERARSDVVIPGKILGRGEKRLSSRKRASLEAATRSSGTVVPKTFAGSDIRSVVREGFDKCSVEDSCCFAVVERAAPASRDAAASVTPFSRLSGLGAVFPLVGKLLRGKAYAATKSKAFELFLHLDQLVGYYVEDVRTRDSELSEAREANIILQSRLDELVERNRVLERDALSEQRSKKDVRRVLEIPEASAAVIIVVEVIAAADDDDKVDNKGGDEESDEEFDD
ncbi:hypothetical protein AALP_AAs55088U000200 [Arabis alpina]|uniref:Uncharacterized protein n=1 Tax=Arabis alpina TaxID=50452 RepID=A0A087FYI9_ARAAL|nr:hypothetical protein AALP_AAs55088U000200 [Arabis alpina]